MPTDFTEIKPFLDQIDKVWQKKTDLEGALIKQVLVLFTYRVGL